MREISQPWAVSARGVAGYLNVDEIRGVAAMQPARAVCRDAGFSGNDQLKTNAVQTFRAKGVTSFKTV
jgi:hypothetical protein